MWRKGRGGGVSSLEGVLTITASDLSDNTAKYGGAIENNDSTLIVTYSRIIGNATTKSGGGILSYYGTVTVTSSTIMGNSATRNGGGISSSHDTFTVVNTIISNNSAGEHGGGFINSSDMTITNSTIVANEAGGSGGGISGSYGTLVLTNSILGLNSASALSAQNLSGGLMPGSGSNLIDVDPGFVRNPDPGDDGEWGTLDDDYGDLHLTEYSPAIDMGSDAAVPVDVITDVDGNPRFANARVDLGAYEFQDAVPAGREAASTVVNSPGDALDLYDGVVSLREALLYAGQDDLGTQITFDAALDGGTITLDGEALCLDRGVRIDASALGSVTIDADGRSRVMWILATDEVELVGLTIRGGHTSQDGGGIYGYAPKLVITGSTVVENTADRDGGGIYAYSGTVKINDSTIVGNESGNYGGGVYGDEATITISESFILENSTYYRGGGVCGEGTIMHSTLSGNVATYHGGGAHWNGTISDSTISGNLSSSTGGGVFLENGTVLRCTISGNQTGSGGGLWTSTSSAAIIDSTISGNTARDGGGVFTSRSTLQIIGSTITGNSTTSGSGAGISNGYTTLTITDSIISGNVAAYDGGGICNIPSTDTTVTITNSLIVGNSAGNRGGGIDSNTSSEMLTIVSSTIAGNAAADSGGGIYSDTSTVILQNSIVALNEAPNLADLRGKPHATSDYCLIGVWPPEYGTPPGDHAQWGTPEAPLDPLFVRNPDDGGDGWGDDPATTEVDESANDDYGDLHLRGDSPAVNAGSNELAVDSEGAPLETDLDGKQRVIYTTVDLGAYEFCLVADANYDTDVDQLDAAILAAHWGLSDMTWGNGDFNGDGLVNATDAAILAANWGATYTPPVQESSPTFFGPLPVATNFTSAQLIQRVGRVQSETNQAEDSSSDVEQSLLPTACCLLPTVEPTAYRLLPTDAHDAALTEQYDPVSQTVLHQDLAWSHSTRRSLSPKSEERLSAHDLAIELLDE